MQQYLQTRVKPQVQVRIRPSEEESETINTRTDRRTLRRRLGAAPKRRRDDFGG